MDKRVIFAVAGAGKTTYIINSLSLEKRALVITYTNNNYRHLRSRIIQKFGCIPLNITILTYYTFLYSFCYRPFLHDKYNSKGINWNGPLAFTLRLFRSDKRFYMDSKSRLHSNRIAKLIDQEKVTQNVRNRLEKYFDQWFVDEVQDFGGHDFNLLISLCSSNLNICLVGDFFQHTYDTSRDGNLNQSLYDDFTTYTNLFKEVGLTPDTTSLSHSYRCTSQICEFITNQLGIQIQSHKLTSSEILFITDKEQIMEKIACNETVKLFFQEHAKYPCFSENWGKSKGQDHFKDICVILNSTTMKHYQKGDFSTLAISSRNKLYVACTRANRNLFFIDENEVKYLKN